MTREISNCRGRTTEQASAAAGLGAKAHAAVVAAPTVR